MGLFGSAPKVPDTVPDRHWGKVTRGERNGAVRADPPGARHGDVLRRVMAWQSASKRPDAN